ncbi:hypothetical protein [Hydrogenophaga sp.]|uniref:hypothetical protein n=1 Tax=Hydrogenophaga sp. TaxID=1904254 RepID=UPI0035B2E1A9
MKFVSNAGTDRVLDLIRPWLKRGYKLDVVSDSFSLFAFSELLNELPLLDKARIVVPPLRKAGEASSAHQDDLSLLGTTADRQSRNKLQSQWLARKMMHWLEAKAEVHSAKGSIPQGTLVLRDDAGDAQQAVLGSFGFSTEGLGITPGNPLNLIQASENASEARMLSQWFDMQWAQLENHPETKASLLAAVTVAPCRRSPLA